MTHPLNMPVAALLRDVAAAAVLPLFRRLAREHVHEKSPGEVVTAADRHAEALLERGLHAILPQARFVGEEGCSDDPSLAFGLDRDLAWIVDPLDGTANFAAGQGPIGIIVALVDRGEVEAGWLYDPLADRLCHATRNGGAFVNGIAHRIERRAPARPVAALATQFMTPPLRAAFTERCGTRFDVVPIPRCAAEHYPRLAFRGNDVAVFQRTLPWDHAAGALFLTEAGGRVARWDGTPYRFHDDGLGIVAAADGRTLGMMLDRMPSGEALAGADRLQPQRLDLRLPPARAASR